MNALVVIYSRTGRTRRVGQEIAAALGAELEVIADRRSRRGLFGFLRSGCEALQAKTPAITPPQHDPRDYDLVVIGTPIWGGRMASPIRTYLMRFRGAFRRAAFFCTSQGGGHRDALAEMARLAGVEPVATLEVSAREMQLGQDAEAIKEFAARLAEHSG